MIPNVVSVSYISSDSSAVPALPYPILNSTYNQNPVQKQITTRSSKGIGTAWSDVLRHTEPVVRCLTLNLLTWTKLWAPASARKWQMGFNSAFKGLIKPQL